MSKDIKLDIRCNILINTGDFPARENILAKLLQGQHRVKDQLALGGECRNTLNHTVGLDFCLSLFYMDLSYLFRFVPVCKFPGDPEEIKSTPSIPMLLGSKCRTQRYYSLRNCAFEECPGGTLGEDINQSVVRCTVERRFLLLIARREHGDPENP